MKSAIRTEGFQLQIRKLTEVSRSITYAASLDEVFQLTVDRAAELLAAERSLLMVANNDGLLALRSSHGVDIALAQDFQEPFSEMLIQRLASRLDAQPEDFLGVPLVVAGAVTGILVVIRSASSPGADHDEWLLSALADQASAALEKTRLDEIGEFREQLVGIVGHDLRNPLSAILTGAHILHLSEGLGEKETRLVRMIMRNATQATRLIDQLLDLTRGRLGGGIPIDPTRFDLNDVCQQVVDETQLTHPERPLRVDVRGDSTGVWDRDRMYQLFANLVGNAVHHGEPLSPIEVRIDGGETEVVITFANQGEPIPPATLPFIFDAFRKGRTVHPSRTQGLGLGLFIVRQIARSHGGTIAVTSSASEGTTFRVRLPRDGPISQHSRHAS
jgi:sigma-B regulation protein RsbU (phosphoserine phosphatase)